MIISTNSQAEPPVDDAVDQVAADRDAAAARWPTVPRKPASRPATQPAAKSEASPVLFTSTAYRPGYILAMLLPFVIALGTVPFFHVQEAFFLSMAVAIVCLTALGSRAAIKLSADEGSLRQLKPTEWSVDWNAIERVEILPRHGGTTTVPRSARVLVHERGRARLGKGAGRFSGFVDSQIPLAAVERWVELIEAQGIKVSVDKKLGRPGVPALDAGPEQTNQWPNPEPRNEP